MAQPQTADAAGMFREPTAGQLERFAVLVAPHLARLDASLARRLKSAQPAAHDPRQLKAFLLITCGAAARLINAGSSAASFLEQVAYNSRRLAKLNVPLTVAVDTLCGYDRDLDRLLARRFPRHYEEIRPVHQHLHYRSLLTVNEAYFQVREAETQAFYGLLHAEEEAAGLDDLLRRFIQILTRSFHAQSGRLIPLPEQPPLASRLVGRLSLPRYIAAGSRGENLVLDAGMRGACQSYWSIPFFSGNRLAGLLQFGFSTPYRWLPRELDLLNAFAERCLRAADRARLVHELGARTEQVRALAGHLMLAEEAERRRIAREVHDEAGQSMLFLRLHLEMLEKKAPPALQPKLAEARGVAERVIAEVRRMVAALSPSAVEELGLPAAIRHLSGRFRKVSSIELRLKLAPYSASLPRETQTTIYRIVQECYQNIAKHSKASHVNLLLRSTDKQLELRIDDDGVGFDVESAVAQPHSFGLKGMRERVALLGGRLEIRSSPGNGAAIHVRIPIPSPQSSRSSGNECDHGNPNVIDR